jgi:CubicO group peptidase (beta-lactamase class C family)
MKAAVLALSCVLCAPFAAQAADPLPRAKPESVWHIVGAACTDPQADRRRDRARSLPGAVLAIARRGKLVHFEAYGYLDKAAGVPMRTDAIFSIASMTKPMVAVAGLQLYEQGRVLMDEPLAKYFPKFSNMQVAVLDAKKDTIVDRVPATRKITIRAARKTCIFCHDLRPTPISPRPSP